MKVTLHSVSTGTAPDRLIATLSLDAAGHAICEPPDALDPFLREGHLDLADRSLTLKDGAAFLRALAAYPLGGYLYATLS